MSIEASLARSGRVAFESELSIESHDSSGSKEREPHIDLGGGGRLTKYSSRRSLWLHFGLATHLGGSGFTFSRIPLTAAFRIDGRVLDFGVLDDKIFTFLHSFYNVGEALFFFGYDVLRRSVSDVMASSFVEKAFGSSEGADHQHLYY